MALRAGDVLLNMLRVRKLQWLANRGAPPEVHEENDDENCGDYGDSFSTHSEPNAQNSTACRILPQGIFGIAT